MATVAVAQVLMTTLLLSQDLMLVSQVTNLAASLGGRAESVGTIERLVSRCGSDDVQQVLFDLNLPGVDPLEVVRQVQHVALSRPRLIAFGPHVHTARLEAARQAGCDLVLTRGQFHRELKSLLLFDGTGVD